MLPSILKLNYHLNQLLFIPLIQNKLKKEPFFEFSATRYLLESQEDDDYYVDDDGVDGAARDPSSIRRGRRRRPDDGGVLQMHDGDPVSLR